MPVFVGLLRAVNLGGSSQVRMEALVRALSRGGFEEVRTVLRSGNVLCRSNDLDPSWVERAIESQLFDSLGLSTDVFVRTASEWRAIVRRNPFAREAEADPAHLVVTFLKHAPSDDEWNALRRSIQGHEAIVGSGREAFIVYPDGIGRSKLTAARIEKKLATRGTSRNWNTVLKLHQFVSS
jgi:uncharacterized protein (DUF1697 family)